MTLTTGFIYNDSFLDHDTGAGHPECPARLNAVMSFLLSQPVYRKLQAYTTQPANLELIHSNHDIDYTDRARQTCLDGHPFLDSMDVAICQRSFDIALLATGATLTLADHIIEEEINNGFALIRPPGHHAERDQALGFCLFNNVAILARYLRSKYGLDKIAIIDWDVHHGNGTQHSFETDPSVLYISIHQYPYYPGTGAYSETGIGRGKGATLNCPMSAGYGDTHYELAFKDQILPKIDAFKPEFIIISAGFDAHKDDPLGQIELSTEFFGWMSLRLLELAEKHCNGRLLSVLEGGYNLKALPLCVNEHLKAMTGLAQ